MNVRPSRRWQLSKSTGTYLNRKRARRCLRGGAEREQMQELMATHAEEMSAFCNTYWKYWKEKSAVQKFFKSVFFNFNPEIPVPISEEDQRKFVLMLRDKKAFDVDYAIQHFDSFFNIIYMQVRKCEAPGMEFTQGSIRLHLKFANAARVIVDDRYPIKFHLTWQNMPKQMYLECDPDTGKVYHLDVESYAVIPSPVRQEIRLLLRGCGGKERKVDDKGIAESKLSRVMDVVVTMTVSLWWKHPASNSAR